MRLKHSKKITYREKLGDEWIAIYAEKYEPKTWNVGCCIYKAKRAQNDWYAGRKNKRAKKIKNNKIRRGYKSITSLWRAFNKTISKIDKRETIIIYTTKEHNVSTIHKYMSKLEFIATPTDIGWFWVRLPAEQ